jgi:hypothetical protein
VEDNFLVKLNLLDFGPGLKDISPTLHHTANKILYDFYFKDKDFFFG